VKQPRLLQQASVHAQHYLHSYLLRRPWAVNLNVAAFTLHIGFMGMIIMYDCYSGMTLILQNAKYVKKGKLLYGEVHNILGS
jgi:hypothetical protein